MTAVLAGPAGDARFTAAALSGLVPAYPSQGFSDDANQIRDSLRDIQKWASGWLAALTVAPQVPKGRPQSTAERLQDALANAKLATSEVVMHLNGEWRNRLFEQLDDLLSIEDWHEDDEPLSDASFRTFLRLILYQKAKRRPGLGLSHRGHLIAAWTTGADRLTLECGADDMIRWVLSCEVGGQRERAAGETHVARLPEVLRPYDPDRWFADAGQACG